MRQSPVYSVHRHPSQGYLTSRTALTLHPLNFVIVAGISKANKFPSGLPITKGGTMTTSW